MGNKNIRLLLVEDDKVDQMAFARFVRDEKLSYEYTIAGSIAASEKLIASKDFDIVISDYMLGDGTLFDLFDLLKGIPVIVTTGTGNEEIAVKAMKLGACDYLIKDPEGRYLRTLPFTVESAVKRNQNEEELRNHRERLESRVKERTAKLEEEITERKTAEEALKKNEKQLRTIIEHSNELFYIHDTEHVLTYVSSTSEAILGYTPEEMKRKWTELVTDNPINLEGVEITENAIKTGKRQKPYLLELEKKDGTFVLLEIDESPVKDTTGKVVAISGALRDVTQKKQTEDRLIKSEQRFRDLFNGINDLIYTQDFEGRFMSVNPALCKAFGYAEDELIGRRASDFMKTEFAPAFKNEYLTQLKQQGRYEGTTIYFKKNGAKLYLEYKSALVQPEDGKAFISGTGRDVTEKVLSARKVAKLQEQVAQSQKMDTIGTLAGGIAHDFNNILFPIVGYTEMLLEDVPEDSPLRYKIKEIYTGALRARDLVKQILTFSRQDRTEIKLMKIQPVIKEALTLIRSTIPTSIEIKQDVRKGCGIIKADPTQIHQVVMNLATNAYHAMEDTGGTLKVTLEEIELGEQDVINPEMEPGNYACLTVADTGVGMDKDLTEKIFDPFFTTKENGKGTGMGLSVVHGIVKSAGGSIHVYSEPGKGTEFHVYLPIVKSSSGQQEIQTEKPIQRGTERILLVDDEEAIVTMEKQLLERFGYQVFSRTSSVEALEAFRANPGKFDIVITDMAMPNMPGDKLGSELVKIRPDIPILLCTGFSERMPEEKAAAMGIKNFLMKPITIKDLSRMIREVLDKAST